MLLELDPGVGGLEGSTDTAGLRVAQVHMANHGLAFDVSDEDIRYASVIAVPASAHRMRVALPGDEAVVESEVVLGCALVRPDLDPVGHLLGAANCAPA